eukprot:gene14125-biopygen5089
MRLGRASCCTKLTRRTLDSTINKYGAQLEAKCFWLGNLAAFLQTKRVVVGSSAPAAPQFLSQLVLVTAVPAEPLHRNQAGPVRPGDLAAHQEYGEPTPNLPMHPGHPRECTRPLPPTLPLTWNTLTPCGNKVMTASFFLSLIILIILCATQTWGVGKCRHLSKYACQQGSRLEATRTTREKRQRTRTGRGPHDRIHRNGRGPHCAAR